MREIEVIHKAIQDLINLNTNWMHQREIPNPWEYIGTHINNTISLLVFSANVLDKGKRKVSIAGKKD